MNLQDCNKFKEATFAEIIPYEEQGIKISNYYILIYYGKEVRSKGKPIEGWTYFIRNVNDPIIWRTAQRNNYNTLRNTSGEAYQLFYKKWGNLIRKLKKEISC